MTSRDSLLAHFENLDISKTKQDSEKLKTPFKLTWKCCSVEFKIGSTIFFLAVALFKQKLYTVHEINCSSMKEKLLYTAQNSKH